MIANIRPRPTRIAYLVEENDDWQIMLDAISGGVILGQVGRPITP